MATMSSAAGYQNLPVGNWAPAIYSQKVLKYFRRASVVEAITNTDYTGELENFGDTVNIIKEPTITVKDYARGQTVNTENLDDNQIQLIIDHRIDKTLHINIFSKCSHKSIPRLI